MGDAEPQLADRLEDLYRSEQRGLTAAAWMILGSREAAEDAVHHGFTALGGRGLVGIDNPAAYLRTAVMNECRRQLRQRRRVELRATMPEAGRSDELHDLAAVLDGLSPRRRMAVVLRYWCDLPVNDIAELMHCRPSTVSSLLNRSHDAPGGCSMPTEPTTTDDALRARFAHLREHLERALDDSLPTPRSVALRDGPRAPVRHRVVAAAAVLLIAVGAGAGAWLAGRDPVGSGGVSTTDGSRGTDPPATSTETSETSEPTVDGVWPPPAEVHEHCVEDAATRALYAEGDYPSEAVRAQFCERSRHAGLLELVFTPEGVGPGAVRSQGSEIDAVSDELHAALLAHGLDGNDLGVQVDSQVLWRAFQNRHARPVVDRSGEQIGWFGGGHRDGEGGFVSLEDMPTVRAAAERTIAEFERTGVLPTDEPGG